VQYKTVRIRVLKISSTYLAHLLKATALILWDEAPMAHKSNIEALDTVLRDILEIDRPFGGVTSCLS
jgi:hypothetical protein